MRGIVSFKQFYPEWKGHWNYLSKDNQETVNRSQTISYKRSPKIWPFIPEDEKQNYDVFTDSVRKGVKMAYPDYQEYLTTHLKKYACEFCGLWEGSFYMENSRVPIKESFRLGIAYCGPVIPALFPRNRSSTLSIPPTSSSPRRPPVSSFSREWARTSSGCSRHSCASIRTRP
mgnify:CR=1 FL=1